MILSPRTGAEKTPLDTLSVRHLLLWYASGLVVMNRHPKQFRVEATLLADGKRCYLLVVMLCSAH